MAEVVKSILMGLGCLTILGFVGCSMMGAGVMVAADRAAEGGSFSETEPDSDKSPWDK
ncbi:hypothetical protein [Sphingopyxis sp. JAI128]|uniref:hypothetical protein n=1 Tax=Sphingopyxis sp. JAI128 TaxID=2723066 RepID=UPI00160A04FC|nr:hypothetical protein [Sphingopyxis sp. JAI128]MBB6427495.1 hypothetical protein [Sphingopyxis sp. JAI128]